jgi:hypothetical protein
MNNAVLRGFPAARTKSFTDYVERFGTLWNQGPNLSRTEVVRHR